MTEGWEIISWLWVSERVDRHKALGITAYVRVSTVSVFGLTKQKLSGLRFYSFTNWIATLKALLNFVIWKYFLFIIHFVNMTKCVYILCVFDIVSAPWKWILDRLDYVAPFDFEEKENQNCRLIFDITIVFSEKKAKEDFFIRKIVE